MRSMTGAQFADLLARRASARLKAARARLPLSWSEWLVQEGPVREEGDWEPFRTLEEDSCRAIVVDGSVSVGRLFAMQPHPEADYSGVLLVLGNLECRHFAGYYGGLVIVDGDLTVNGVAVNSFGDSSLMVLRNFRVHYFHGLDIWANVGGSATMEYGWGYVMPMDQPTQPGAPLVTINPVHDEAASLRHLGIDGDDAPDEATMVRWIREGRFG